MSVNLRELIFLGFWFEVLYVVVLLFGGMLLELFVKKI